MNKPFPWRSGMLVQQRADPQPTPIHGWELRVVRLDPHGAWLARGSLVLEDAKPVESDPATLGALLGAVRDAWDDDAIHMWRGMSIHDGLRYWVVVNDERGHLGRGPTEFAALIAAYEAAP